MKKEIFFDRRAYKDLKKFIIEVQAEFRAALEILEEKGKLESPLGKKIDNELFEIRIRYKGAWRGFYAYMKGNQVMVLHVFKKKTQKTPRKELII